MKQFEIYRNIRKRAVIFGLPITSLAFMMLSIVASLLVLMFSFSFAIIIGVLVFNCAFYGFLLRLTTTSLFQVSGVFPHIISNKRNSNFDYEQN